jgi:hypothetical protein
MERAGFEPAPSDLQTQPIARPHLTPTDRIGMTEPYSVICRTSPDTVRRRSARSALARPVPKWATIVRSSRTRARRSGDGGDRPPYHALETATGRNRRQQFRRVSALSKAVRFATVCDRLQPRGSIKTPSFVVSVGNNSPHTGRQDLRLAPPLPAALRRSALGRTEPRQFRRGARWWRERARRAAGPGTARRGRRGAVRSAAGDTSSRRRCARLRRRSWRATPA